MSRMALPVPEAIRLHRCPARTSIAMRSPRYIGVASPRSSEQSTTETRALGGQVAKQSEEQSSDPDQTHDVKHQRVALHGRLLRETASIDATPAA